MKEELKKIISEVIIAGAMMYLCTYIDWSLVDNNTKAFMICTMAVLVVCQRLFDILPTGNNKKGGKSDSE